MKNNSGACFGGHHEAPIGQIERPKKARGSVIPTTSKEMMYGGNPMAKN